MRRKLGIAIPEMIKTAFDTTITKSYPFRELEVSERFRGKLDIDPDKCTGCGVCAMVCPASVITMVELGKRKVGDREVPIRRPLFNLYNCIACGQCVDDCRFNALRLTKEFELAVSDKNSLIMRKAIEHVS
jgi:formate hydrogenlyase subunit 6/NADH:ubiquinone oxidoreductase subunit I